MRSPRRWLILWIGGCLCAAASASAQSLAASNARATSTGDSDQQQSGAPASTSESLTRKKAEALALKNNPQITIGRLRALEAAQLVRAQRSALLPAAYLSITAADASNNSRIAAGALNNPIIFERAASGATVSQLITDFGRTANLVASAKSAANAEEENSAATTAQITIAVDQAFYNTLETRALLKVAQQTVDARQLIADRVGALTQAKLKSDLDMSFANVDLARAKLLQLESKNNYQVSLAVLSAILGYPDEQNFDLQESTRDPEQPESDVTPLILTALRLRPEVLALQAQVESAEAFAHAEHDLWRPTVSAIGAVGTAPVRDDHLPNWYGAAGININIPVFNGFLFNARGKTADLQTEVNRQKLADVRNNIAREVRSSWHDSQRAYERLTVTQQLRQQANLGLDLAQARYNLGLGSIVELGQAELQKTEADIADTDAQYQYRLARLVLAYNIGQPK
jgi:outer membrane protein